MSEFRILSMTVNGREVKIDQRPPWWAKAEPTPSEKVSLLWASLRRPTGSES